MHIDQQLAYCAGFFDGEGCISFEAHPNGGFTLRCITAQKYDDRPLELMEEVFGGSVYQFASGVNKHVIVGKKAVAMLERFMPLLIVKERQARIAVMVFEMSREERLEAVQALHELKKSKFLGA